MLHDIKEDVGFVLVFFTICELNASLNIFQVISVSISVGVATLFLYKIFRARIQNGKRNEKTLKRLYY